MKFINMKYHDAYLLYYSVLFVVIVVFIVMKNVRRMEARDKKLENSSGLHFFVLKFWSAPGKTKTRKVFTRNYQ